MKRLGTYLVWVGGCEILGLLGGIVTFHAVATWYPALVKPSWTPPNWVFGPVWTVLYALMGIAAARVWIHHRGTRSGRYSLMLFGVQLALNCTWSVLFFAVRVPGYAFVEIVLLWITILALVLWWWWLDRKASLLLVPYLAWAGFAGALNATIWNLNP
jgi:tryptophan-rich sensory protein